MAYLRELVSGNWQAVVRRSGHKPISKSFDTKAQALQWARLLESEIDRGIFVDRIPPLIRRGFTVQRSPRLLMNCPLDGGAYASASLNRTPISSAIVLGSHVDYSKK